MTCNDGKQKHAMELVNKNMVDEREREKIKYTDGGRRAENKI
jgi:hypothetical protein